MSDDKEELSDTLKVVYGILSVLLVIAAGGTAGLQVALFSIDRVFLKVLSATGTPKERYQANKLIRILSKQHWTLVGLTLLNAASMMSLPLVLESLFDELTALLVSITAVLFVGEVVPLAVFVRWPIPICSFFAPVFWIGIIGTAPISWPVGKLLDRLLGTHEMLLDREDIAALIMSAPQNGDSEGGEDSTTVEYGSQGIQSSQKKTPYGLSPATAVAESLSDGRTESADLTVEPAVAAAAAAVETAASPSNQHRLSETEAKMLQGAMQLSTDTVMDHLRVREPEVFMLSSQDVLDQQTIRAILSKGFSRVPVYFGADRMHIIGALIVNSLFTLCYANPQPPPLVGDYPLREVMRLAATSSLFDAYVAFRDGALRMAVVYDEKGTMLGLLTLTDVLAGLYQANPSMTVSISAYGVRRGAKMRVLVEGMKCLNSAKSAGALSPCRPLAAAIVRKRQEVLSPASVALRVPFSANSSPLAGSTRLGLARTPHFEEMGSLSAHSLSEVVAAIPRFTLVGTERSSSASPAPAPTHREEFET